MELPPSIARLAPEAKRDLLEAQWAEFDGAAVMRESTNLPDLSAYSVEQKLEIIEALASELEPIFPELFESPPWHAEVLQERIQEADSPEAVWVSLEDLRAELLGEEA